MEGLEATIIPSSALERTVRLDAEYFQKRFLRSAEIVDRWEKDHVASLTKVSDGNHFTISDDFVERGIPYYRGQDVVDHFFVESADPNFITDHAYNRSYMKRSHLKKGDVLLSIIGTIGELSLVGTDQRATCSCKLAILRPREIEAEFLAVFLRSEHGRNQIRRLTRGAVQQGILLEDMDQLWVPKMSDRLRGQIVSVVRSALAAKNNAESKLRSAEQILLAELGLKSWIPPEPLSYTTSSKTVFAADRLDAQYFRPLFSEIEDRLRATGRAVNLGAILSTNARGRQPQYSDMGLPVINSKHVRTNRVILSDNRRAIEEGSTIFVKTGDVLVNGTGVGTIGRAAPYLHKQRALPDNHVTVLRSTHVDPVYLAAFLNSPLGQWQIERSIRGSSGQIELYPSDIANITFWDAPKHVQRSIRDAVLSAFTEEHRAQNFLDTAKHAAEIAIEKDEDCALSYLTQNTQHGASSDAAPAA